MRAASRRTAPNAASISRRRVHAADARPPAPPLALNSHRDTRARSACASAASSVSAGPPPHGTTGMPGLFGQPLRVDLVAQPAHRAAVGPDERDAQPLAQLGELRALADESPARSTPLPPAPRSAPVRAPRSPGTSGRRRPSRSSTKVEGPRTTDSSASRTNRAWRSGSVKSAITAEVGPVLEVELADGMDEPHGGLATIDDGHAAEVGCACDASVAGRPGARRRTGTGGERLILVHAVAGRGRRGRGACASASRRPRR